MNDLGTGARLTRRALIRRLGMTSAAAAGLPWLIAACQSAPAAAPTGVPAATTAPAAASQRTLTVSTWGGITQDGIKAHVEPEFQKQTGATIAYDIGGQGARYNKLLAQKGTPTIDVFFSADEAVVAGHQSGVLQPVTRQNVPNLADVQDWAFTVKDFGSETTTAGVPYTLIAYGLAYNPDLVKDPPKGWADMWRPEFLGKLALADVSHSQMPALVIIAAELAGGSADKVDPAFAKLAELRPAKLTVFWTDWAPLDKSGDVSLATEFDYYVQAMKDQKYPIEWVWPEDKAIATPEYMSVVKGAKEPQLAEAFMNLMLAPQAQQAFAVESYQGPVNKKVQLDATAAPRVSYGDNIKKLRFFDPKMFAANRAAWTERLNTEVVPKWGSS